MAGSRSKASIYCSRLVNCHSVPTPLYMLQYAFCYPLSSPLIMQIVFSAFPSTQILGIISFYTQDRPKNEDDKVKKNSEKRKAALRIKWLHSVISWHFSSNLFSIIMFSVFLDPFNFYPHGFLFSSVQSSSVLPLTSSTFGFMCSHNSFEDVC